MFLLLSSLGGGRAVCGAVAILVLRRPVPLGGLLSRSSLSLVLLVVTLVAVVVVAISLVATRLMDASASAIMASAAATMAATPLAPLRPRASARDGWVARGRSAAVGGAAVPLPVEVEEFGGVIIFWLGQNYETCQVGT